MTFVSSLSHPSSLTEEKLADLVCEITNRIQAGESVDLEAFVAQAPEYEQRLRQLVPAVQTLVELGASSPSDAAIVRPLVSGDSVQGTLGDFRIMGEIGRGGMGVVYEAEQVSLGRRLALKVLPYAAVMDQKAITRFRNEARAAATLDHPNIVPVHAVGNERGVYYYAMALIQGMTLAEVIGQLQRNITDESLDEAGRLSIDEIVSGTSAAREDIRWKDETIAAQAEAASQGPNRRFNEEAPGDLEAAISTHRSCFDLVFFRNIVRLGVQAAEALEHAHQHGIVHRDIKPGNLMIDTNGKLWVTDFGLARIESDAGMTMTGDLVGTLRYMSPEQALAKRVVVDHRADIYALGVTLYELLTLRPAFDGENRAVLLRQIAFDEPQPLRNYNRAVPEELQTIVLKAISKNPDERYNSAQDMAEDLRAFQQNRPIKAKPPSPAQRLKKWSQRHKSLVVSAVAILLLAVIGLTVASVTLARQRDLALRQKAEIATQLRVAHSLRLAAHAQSRLNQDPVQSLLLAVESMETVQRENEPIPPFAQQSLRDTLAVVGGQPFVRGRFVVSANNRWLANKQQDRIRLFDLSAPWSQQIIVRGDQRTWLAAVSSDGQWVLTGVGKDQGNPRTLRVWNLHSKDPRIVLEAGEGLVWKTTMSRDSRWLAVGVYGKQEITIRLWDLMAPDISGSVKVLRGVTTQAFEFSPDSRWLASSSQHGPARLWDLTTKDHLASATDLQVGDQEGGVRSLAFSPDSRRLAAGTVSKESRDCSARLWDLTSPNPEASPIVLRGHRIEIGVVAFSPNGRWFVTADMDTTARLWDLHADEQNLAPIVLRGHRNVVLRAAFSPDNRWLVTGGHDRTARVWDLNADDPAARSVILRGHAASISRVIFTTDSQWVLTNDADHAARLWNLSADSSLDLSPGPHISRESATDPLLLSGRHSRAGYLGFLQDSSKFLSPGKNNTLRLWDLSLDNPARDPRVFQGDQWNAAAEVSGDSRWLAMGDRDGTLRLWDLNRDDPAAGPRVLAGHNDRITRIEFSQDNRWLATGGRDRTVRIWDLGENDLDLPTYVLRGHEQPIGALQFSPDGQWLATADVRDAENVLVRLWDFSTGAITASPFVLRGHQARVQHVIFSPDTRWLATGSEDNTVRLWDLNDEDPAAAPVVLRGHESSIRNLWFSPNGRWLATGSGETAGREFTGDVIVRLWDLSADQFAAKSFVYPKQFLVGGKPFAPDSSLLATVGQDFTVRLWDLGSVDPSAGARELRGHTVLPRSLAFSPDGRWLATSAGWDPRQTESNLHLWDLASPRPEASAILLRSTIPARRLAFSPDSRRLAGQGYNGTVRIWNLDTDTLLALARRAAGRQLTAEERKEFFSDGP